MKTPLLLTCWLIPFLVVFLGGVYLTNALRDLSHWVALASCCLAPAVWARLHYRFAHQGLQARPFKTCVVGSLLSAIILTVASLIIGGVVLCLLTPNFFNGLLLHPESGLENYFFIAFDLIWIFVTCLFVSSLISSILIMRLDK